MSKKTIYFIISLSIVISATILKSVVFPLFFSTYFMPDFSLIAIIYFSINYGKNVGQIFGFTTGFVLDSLSGAPFGLNALIRVVMGYLLGFFKGTIFLDRFILPSIMITICTLIKYGLFYIVKIIYPIDLQITLISINFLVELGFNIILTPFIFIFFGFLAKRLSVGRDAV